MVGLGFVLLFSIRNKHVKLLKVITQKTRRTRKRPLTFINEAKGTDSGIRGCVQALDAFSTPGSVRLLHLSLRKAATFVQSYAFIHCL